MKLTRKQRNDLTAVVFVVLWILGMSYVWTHA